MRDIRRTLSRRWPAARVYLLPVLVQGEGAAADIAGAIAAMDAAAAGFEIDTIIVGRGGGSLEDLWAFNEEIVARAIYACRTPIISGVGHEVDTTISDLVADVPRRRPPGRLNWPCRMSPRCEGTWHSSWRGWVDAQTRRSCIIAARWNRA